MGRFVRLIFRVVLGLPLALIGGIALGAMAWFGSFRRQEEDEAEPAPVEMIDPEELNDDNQRRWLFDCTKTARLGWAHRCYEKQTELVTPVEEGIREWFQRKKMREAQAMRN